MTIRLAAESRAVIGTLLASLAQDVRFAFRSFRLNPLFTTAAVVTLGLGIAATTSVVSVVDATLLRPLPFPAPERVANVVAVDDKRGYAFGITRAQVEALRSSPVFESVADYASYSSQTYTVARADGPQVIHGANVSPDFFTVFRVRPAVGRIFTAGDGNVEQPAVCILTAAGLRRLFNGRRDVVGQTLSFVEGQLTVVGVMSDSFWYPIAPRAKMGRSEPGPDLLVPIAARARFSGPDSRWDAAARLRPGATPAQAEREAKAIVRRHSTPNRDGSYYGTRARLLQDEMAADVRPTLLTLLGFAACLLLICCVNIANLLLSHSNARTRELALRTTLGAGRLRLVRQLLTEYLVLAAMGGAAGLCLSMATLNTFVRLLPTGLLVVPRLDLDSRVLGLAAGVTLITGLLAGLGPALLATRGALADVIKAGGGATRHTPRWRSFASLLLVVESAVLMVLLSGGGLLVNTLVRLKTVDLGFDPARLWTAEFVAPKALYPETAQVGLVGHRAAEALARLPGVVAVGESDWGLLGGFCPGTTIAIDGRAETLRPQTRHVSAEYFAAVNMETRAGRLWTAQDENVKPEVAVINEAAARAYWPKEDPVGQRMTVNEKWPVRIVGVVRDLREADEREAPGPSVYLPLNPISTRFYRARTLVLRTSQPLDGLGLEVVKAIAAIDPRVPVTVNRSDQTLSDRRQDPRFYAVVVGIAAAFALLLAAIGIGGLTAQGVARRTREIGVRLALGAEVAGVVGMIVRQICGPVLIGTAVGVGGALALSRVLTTFLYGITPQDTATHVVALVLLVGIALAAAVVPARRAARVNPVEALRSE
jgi:predicted permease